MIDPRHLLFATTAAAHGSFRRAAELLSVRQSTLSRGIRQLEYSIDTKIFERSSSGIRPTLAGRRFLRIARTILEQIDALTISKWNGSSAVGRVAVGLCTSLSAGNLRATLLDFKHRFPETEILTSEKSRARLATSLRNGTLDILLITGDTSIQGSKSQSLWSERILVALPQNHSLAEREVVYWTDLRNETVLLGQYDPVREIEDLLNAKLVSPTDRPKIERHDVSRGTIKSLVAMRSGVSLVLESDLGANFSTLVYRELRDGTGPSRVGFSAHWQEDNENPALEKFLKLLSERYPPPDACG